MVISSKIDLAIIVDPEYGNRLEDFAAKAPAWIVGSNLNQAVCKRIWDRKEHTDHRETGAVTSYKVADLQDRLGNLLNIFPNIELHHGEGDGKQFTFPSGFQIEIAGLLLDDNVITHFKSYGFTSFTKTSDGFRMKKENS